MSNNIFCNTQFGSERPVQTLTLSYFVQNRLEKQLTKTNTLLAQ